MKSLNSTAEHEERMADYQLLTSPEIVRVAVDIPNSSAWETLFLGSWPKGQKRVVWAEFKTMTMGDEWMIERLTRGMHEVNGKQEPTHDYEERKRLVYRFMLRNWNLNIKLEHEQSSGWLTESCWHEVMRQPGPILENLASAYQNAVYVSREEEETIIKQCGMLFAKGGRGVKHACEAVSLFCTLGNFWEKFGINRFDLARLPYKEFLMLQMVLSNEIEKQKAQAHAHKKSPTRIAGPGGKTRPSRGVVVSED
jgi:hypothetical protein